MPYKAIHKMQSSSLIPFQRFICIALFCISILSLIGYVVSTQPKVMSTRGILLNENDFVVEQGLQRPADSLIVCGSQFLVVKEMVEYPVEVNGYHYDDDRNQCLIGKVSFPIDEVEQGGIRVHGISKEVADILRLKISQI